jgi:uncharacterized protein (DUF2235 family)
MFAGKRLALFLDGTWNTLNNNTNIWRMKSLCRQSESQMSYYSAGVGTQKDERLRGGMFGVGLDDEVTNAYEWLVEHYEAGDRIYIFGFSRGAFTARSLAGFISKCGLLSAGGPLSLDQIYARYRLGRTPYTILALANIATSQLSLEDQLLRKHSAHTPIFFQGVYDTVGALGFPIGPFAKVNRSKYAFLETDLRIDHTRAYHALAIDEHREAFAPTLWTKTTSEGADGPAPRLLDAVEQRWFVGAHADVGGGYANGLLSQRPLQWLISKAASHGLDCKPFDIDETDSTATIHDSFAQMAGGLYRLSKLCRPYYRNIGMDPTNVGTRKTSTINETVDISVFDRWQHDSTYRPMNLLQWASTRGINLDGLRQSVRTDDLSVVQDIQVAAA